MPMYVAGDPQPYGFLVMGVNPYRLPDDKFFAFLSLVGDQVATSFADIHVLEGGAAEGRGVGGDRPGEDDFFFRISAMSFGRR